MSDLGIGHGGDLSIAHREVVIRKVCSQGCSRRLDFDAPASYAFTCRKPDAEGNLVERLFFIPRELVGEGYTLTQLQEIEQTLAYYGFDLLPLDHFVN